MNTSNAEAKFESSAALGAPDAVAKSSWVVMKFGGSSVSTARHWKTIARLVQSRLDAGLRPLIVHSALGGVSNALEALLQSAVAGDPSEILDQIRAQHFELAESLGLDGRELLQELFMNWNNSLPACAWSRRSACGFEYESWLLES
jgi:diaminopimelate decarboxylase/aspartate kinase